MESDYLSRQLITCLGNKRALLPHIAAAVDRVKQRLNKKRLVVLDGFAGSGVVSRLLKASAEFLVANDQETFSVAALQSHLTNHTRASSAPLAYVVKNLNATVLDVDLPPGFVEELYAPRDENNITASDRVFYTRENAKRLDNYRRLLEQEPPLVKQLLLGPLLSKASIHVNTSGVFKGFYKNRQTGVGQFGGHGQNALSRIRGTITLEEPVLSRYECSYHVYQTDANKLVDHLPGLDLAYFDPPYNQHPYGSNYFMLNLLATYQRPEHISKVAGIPTNWNRSGYNTRKDALPLLTDLLTKVDAKFVLLSYNNEGFIKPAEIRRLLQSLGTVEEVEIPYSAFRGSRNLHKRSDKVTEFLFLLAK